MDIDLIGRLGKIRLPHTHALSPVFEAIVNSIQAVEEANTSGRIDVFIVREKIQGSFDGEGGAVALGPIIGFQIRDDGMGFTRKNFDSFQTSDSTLKAAKGGKGVGRFLWLKAFGTVRIESTYTEAKKWYRRSFDFRATKAGVENETLDQIEPDKRATVVHLTGYLPGYRDACPKTAATIARHIIEHCMEYYAFNKCPQIMLHDEAAGDLFDLARQFSDHFLISLSHEDIQLKGKKFRLTHLRTAVSVDTESKLFFCADNRSVKAEGLRAKIPNLQRAALCQDDGKPFYYSGLVSGRYLDERVNSERTKFDLFDELQLNMPDEIRWDELIQASIDGVRRYLAPFIEPIQKEKEERIQEFVRSKAPQYRPLLKHRSGELEGIPPNLGDAELDVELYKRNLHYDLELRSAASRIMLPEKEGAPDYDVIRVHFAKFIEEWNEQGISKLAQYIVHRKATLAFFEQRLRVRDDGRYPLEDSVHKIIFPLRETSDDVMADHMNLWMIDEKLSYHHYLASDKYLDKIDHFNIDHHHRPDLVIFNKPFAFAETGPTYASIVIIEFKRPMRDNYQDSEPDKNPISQVYQYVREIRSGTATDRHGRPITIFENTRFYAYIVADMTSTLRNLAEDAGMMLSPDSQGFFYFNKPLNTYVEIISFDKLADDAKKRNAALFDKLNIHP